MSLPALSREQSRAVDKTAMEDYGMSGLVLMENAGRASAERLAEVAPPGEIMILCGRGNNAGDGYVIARHLQLLGRQCSIISVVEIDDLSGDAAANAKVARNAQIPIHVISEPGEFSSALESATCLVDCLLGTGARGELREPFRSAVEAANGVSAKRFAIDVPSGLDCDSGEVHDPTFRADETITFVAPKVGFSKGDASEYTGQVHVIGIGVPKRLLDSMER